MNSEKLKKINIPKTPGCYLFLNNEEKIIYIGKAANLKARVFSYWMKSAGLNPAKKKMLEEIDKIKIIETESEIEALLLEANLIKKFQPLYNIIMRDDKRYQYIKITTDELPRIITTRNIDKSGRYFGPFTSGTAVRETMKAIGKIFPYGKFATMPDNKTNEAKIKRYPELYVAPEDVSDYKKMIKQIIKFLEGNMKSVERNLKLEIENLEKLFKTAVIARSEATKQSRGAEKNEIASSQDIGTRNDMKDKISALKYRLLNMKNVLAHSNILSVHDKYASDVVELAKILGLPKVPKRIEGYDVSHLFGQNAVGSMVVFSGGEPDKSQYRKFKIKNCHCEEDEGRRSNLVKYPNSEIATLSRLGGIARDDRKGGDTAMLKEILERRFNNDWPLPDLIIVDGGRAQLNAGLSILKKIGKAIQIIAVSKGEGLRSAHAPDKIFFPASFPLNKGGQRGVLRAGAPLILPLASPALHIIKRVRDEAHRFAIAYHRNKIKILKVRDLKD